MAATRQMELDATPVWARNMNPEQMEAILHQEGPARLLAVAGAGKTRAVVHRIARMVEQGTRAEDVLAVTFSKKAADEMNERLQQLGIRDARVGTWHSLCLQVIKEDRTRWAEWTIDDSDRAGLILKEVLGFRHLDWKDADAGQVARYITTCKANLARAGSQEARVFAYREFCGTAEGGTEGSREADLASEAYALYQRKLEDRGLLTFDDFLMYAHEHLRIEENRGKWAAKWRHLIIDEYQDDNLAQEAIAELLARDHRNIMAVGDVAQSIYAFRGSSPQYLANFDKTWPGAKTIIMNRNYRSGAAVVEAANRVIAPAEVRLPVDMISERGTAGRAESRCSEDLDAEGEAFAQWIYELLNAGQKLSSVTALFRTNAQSRAMEEALLKKRIPYVVVGGTSFYERREVKDLLGYLRVAANRDPEGESAKRSLNAPFRYLGAAFVERVQDAARRAKRGAAWTDVVLAVAQQAGIQRRQVQSAQDWAALVGYVQQCIAGAERDGAGVREKQAARPSAILDYLVSRTGYISWLEKEQGEESVESSHAANVREMVRIAERFDTVAELLDYIDEMRRAAKRQREDRQAGGERVLLMSIHRSKGLEWPHVWVCGVNEKVLPHHKGDPEEERRLAYVACTRARDHLVLSYVRTWAGKDGVKEAAPSRFLVDSGLLAGIPHGLLDNGGPENGSAAMPELRPLP